MCKNFSINGSQLKHVSLLKIHKSHEQSSSDESKKKKKKEKKSLGVFLTPVVYGKIFSILFSGKEVRNILLKFLEVSSVSLLRSSKRQMT